MPALSARSRPLALRLFEMTTAMRSDDEKPDKSPVPKPSKELQMDWITQTIYHRTKEERPFAGNAKRLLRHYQMGFARSATLVSLVGTVVIVPVIILQVNSIRKSMVIIK
mgnify:CR=1 FL=1